MANKFTFKRQPKVTGLLGTGYPCQGSVIKYRGVEVGWITAPWWGSKDNKYGIILRFVENGEELRVTLKARFDEDADARAFMLKNAEALSRKYRYHEIVVK